MTRHFIGELIGTFILVLIGCSSVALEVLFNFFGNIILIALVWTLAVALAIFTSRKLSFTHLNPAVTFWAFLCNKINLKTFSIYILAQFIGAFIAAFLLYLIFRQQILLKDESLTLASAKMFGEYYSGPTIIAFIMEFLGTLFLLSGIQVIINRVKNKHAHPILIGLTVGVAIVIIAPYTQCGINPARDLAPRVFSYFAGWGSMVFSQHFLLVYIFAPLFASYVFYKVN